MERPEDPEGSTDSVLSELDGSLLRVTLNRPRVRNAMDDGAWDRLFDILRAASTDDQVRVVILSGAEGTFCSGADVSSPSPLHPLSRVRQINRTAEALFSFPKAVIAQVEGYAMGAGWSLALCCDLVVASSTAQFSAMFTRRALSLDFGGSWLFPRLAGLQQAKRLAYTSETVSAQEARELGLVTFVKEPDDLHGFVAELARGIAEMPPVAIAQDKELLHSGSVQSFREALDNEARAQAVNHATADVATARAAAREKTTPVYTGEWSR